ncbi:hypothetical protein PORY_000238 [Pneumocystis oryctolagi]|uniref:Uncharacterized protein n=1 Tax=Pneumocystis oryctolagi TaxID=42067 RepID=A0ACB7CGG4_9ASCO|nr:hypothetical protein PORY_000238 [Pneumocystis oryctolagi]
MFLSPIDSTKKDGISRARIEGRLEGIQTGYTTFLPIGRIRGRCDIWRATLNSSKDPSLPIQKIHRQLIALEHCLDALATHTHTHRQFASLWNQSKARFKALSHLLGEKTLLDDPLIASDIEDSGLSPAFSVPLPVLYNTSPVNLGSRDFLPTPAILPAEKNPLRPLLPHETPADPVRPPVHLPAQNAPTLLPVFPSILPLFRRNAPPDPLNPPDPPDPQAIHPPVRLRISAMRPALKDDATHRAASPLHEDDAAPTAYDAAVPAHNWMTMRLPPPMPLDPDSCIPCPCGTHLYEKCVCCIAWSAVEEKRRRKRCDVAEEAGVVQLVHEAGCEADGAAK